MTREEKIKHLFLEALERPIEERISFLREHGDDEAMMTVVSSLLAAHQGSEELSFETSTEAVPIGLSEVSANIEKAWQIIKHIRQEDGKFETSVEGYEILDEIGCGAMGYVYRAKAMTGLKREKIVLKVMKKEYDTPGFRKRFQDEQQMLAMMNSDYIPKVLEQGETDQGLLFFTMPLIEGGRITDYCDRKRLSIRSRIILFLKVCDGIAHAHLRPVIHRDLKPGNILVDEESGNPKIIDFGLALAMAFPSPQRSPLYHRLGTLPYASPEQAQDADQDVDIRTDLYSLGVLLYELLTGIKPYNDFMEGVETWDDYARLFDDPKNLRKPGGAIENAGNASDLAKNRGTHPKRLVKELAEDLDDIVLKAMNRNRDNRYNSARELANDLRRVLDDLPIQAKSRPGLLYRWKKAFRRRKTAIVTGLLMSIIFLLALAFSYFQWKDGLEERIRNQAFLHFFEVMFSQPDPRVQGPDTPLISYLENQVGTIDQIVNESVKAHIYAILGRTYVGLVQAETARTYLEPAWQWRREHLGERDPRTLTTAYDLGAAYLHLEQFDKVIDLLEPAILAWKALDNKEMELKTRRILADTRKQSGDLSGLASTYENILKAYDDDLDLGRHHPDALLTAVHYTQLLAVVCRKDEARDLLEETLKTMASGPLQRHPYTLNAKTTLIDLLSNPDEKERLARRNLQDCRAFLGERHSFTMSCMLNLANLLEKPSQTDEAEALYQEILALRNRFTGRHWETAVAKNDYADFLNSQGRYQEAEKQIREAIRIFEDSARHHPKTPYAWITLGEILWEGQRYEEAEQWFAQMTEQYTNKRVDAKQKGPTSAHQKGPGLLRSRSAFWEAKKKPGSMTLGSQIRAD